MVSGIVTCAPRTRDNHAILIDLEDQGYVQGHDIPRRHLGHRATEFGLAFRVCLRICFSNPLGQRPPTRRGPSKNSVGSRCCAPGDRERFSIENSYPKADRWMRNHAFAPSPTTIGNPVHPCRASRIPSFQFPVSPT